MLMDRVHNVGVQHHRLVSELGVEPGIAETDAVDGLDAVVEGQNLHKPLDDVVEAGAESARSKNAYTRPVRIMINLVVRACALETRLAAKLLREILNDRAVLRHKYAVFFINEVIVADRRGNLAFA